MCFTRIHLINNKSAVSLSLSLVEDVKSEEEDLSLHIFKIKVFRNVSMLIHTIKNYTE